MDEDSFNNVVPQSQFADPLQSNHVCEVCGKVYETVVQYKNHKKYHQLVRNHKCDWPKCGKTFVSKSLLASHKVTHTGEKAFQCPEENCMRSYATKSSLNHHQRVHTGKKPFQCEVCTFCYSDKSNLNRHIAKKHAHG